MVLAAVAHAVGSGQTVTSMVAATPPVALAAAGLLSVAALGVLGWHRRPWWVAALVLSGVQGCQHLAFLSAGATHASVPAGVGHSHAARLASAAGAGHPVVTVGHLADSHAGHGGHGLVMLAGHVVAATATAALLGHGEHVVRLLLAWLAWWAPLLSPLRPIAPHRILPAPVAIGVGGRDALLESGGRGLRGPPTCPARP